MKSSLGFAVVALATLNSFVTATVDRLVTKRHNGLGKRFVDDAGNYNVTFIHTNDVHAHLDEWRAGRGTDCVEGSECISGYARIKDKVQELKKSVRDPVVLNAGDEFQGTLFFSYYGGEKISYAINEVGYDMFTLGNHEFDKGLDELAEFLGNLTFPTVCANLKTNHTGMNALKIPAYHVIEKHNIGVIGVITPDTKGTSSGAGPGTDFSDPVVAVQAAVDELKQKNVTRIVALTHIGYSKDIELAQKTSGVNLIIGGHSHTLVGSMDGAAGPYPTIATNLDGEEVFVVTAYRWGEYLGRISVAWDSTGKIVSYEGEPIRLDNTTAQDAKLDGEVAEWRKPFDALAKQIVGESSVLLDQSTCQFQECTLGNLITDAMYQYRVDAGGVVDAAIINAGGIRASISAGNVSRGDVLTSFPFLNAVADLNFTGQQVWDMFEGIASDYSTLSAHAVTSFVQVSKEISFSWNAANPNGTRLIDLTIGKQPIDLAKNYTIVVVDFLATGGDYFWAPRTDFVALGTLDEILVAYFQEKSPVNATIEGRIINSTETKQNIPGGTDAAVINGASSFAMVLALFAAGLTFIA